MNPLMVVASVGEHVAAVIRIPSARRTRRAVAVAEAAAAAVDTGPPLVFRTIDWDKLDGIVPLHAHC